MKHYNLFTQLYKGARALLYDVALTLQQTDFAVAAETQATLENMQQALHLFNGYAWMEEKYVVPALKRYVPEAPAIFKGSSEINAGLSLQLKGLLQLHKQATSPRNMQDAGDAITRAYTAFLASKLEHLAKKESILGSVLQMHYTEREVKLFQQNILSALPPQHLVVYYRWIVRGTNNAEIIEWLKNVEQTGSIRLMDLILQMVEQELPTERWKNILDRMAEGKVVG
ncbi:MAG: hypothetical protein QM731_04285 [Chitinophagaceae bacterium]